MKHNLTYTGKKVGAMFLALALAMITPLMALAETATDTVAADATTTATTPVSGRVRGQGFGMLDTDSLTEAQQTTYDNALALYRQIEDAVLADLVAAGAVVQADVDAYTAQRAAAGSLDELDMSTWTALQYKAYYEALQKKGDERKAALQALVDAAQLTQAQADTLAGDGTTDLWQTLAKNAGTNTAVQTAIQTLRQASQTLLLTLRDAGINGLAKGDSIGSFGQNAAGSNADMRPDGARQNAPGTSDGPSGSQFGGRNNGGMNPGANQR